MQLTTATVAEHVAVQEEIASVAGESTSDEPAAAGDAAGGAACDGAGGDEPAEPCTKRARRTCRSGVKEWFCFLVSVKRDWTMAQCLHFLKNTPILLRAQAPQVDRAEDFQYHSWSPTLPGTRSHPGLGRHLVARLQQSVLWRRSVGRTPERSPGITWRRLPRLHPPVPKIHPITWVLLHQETQGRPREGVAGSSDTDTQRIVPAEDRVDARGCGHHGP